MVIVVNATVITSFLRSLCGSLSLNECIPQCASHCYKSAFQIIVVPDATAAQNVPPVPGLLEYRKDNKKLYIRSNETWNVVGEEQRVTLIFF